MQTTTTSHVIAYSQIKALSLLLALGTIWGTGYSMAKFAMTHGVTPLGYSFWQSFGPALAMLFSAFFVRQRIALTKKHLYYYAVCGLIGIALPNTVIYFAAVHLPAGILAVIVNTAPVMTYPIALMARQERFSIFRFIGIFLAIVGVMFIVLPNASIPAPDVTLWVAISLLAPLSFACSAIYIAQQRSSMGTALTQAAGMLSASVIFLIPLLIRSGEFYPLHPPFNSADYAIILEIILSSIGYVIFFKLLRMAGSVFYSLVDSVVALTGLVWGYLIFDERLSSWAQGAVLLILLGVSLVTLYQRNTDKG